MFRFAVGALALAFATPVFGQDAERMDEVVTAEAESGVFMGSAIVAIGDEIVLDKGYGSANLSCNIPNDGATKHRIGSVTKQFTAVAVLLLQEQGKLSLDAPISTYLDDTPEAWSAITVKHLLNHASGIPNVTNLPKFGTQKFLPTTRDELIAIFRDLPLEFTPGDKYSYSNSGYVLLSSIVEDTSGEPYADFVREAIFEPLGMSDTAIEDNSSIVRNRASGYILTPSGLTRADYVNMDIPTGAGALYSTTRDLVKWQRGLFGGKLLSPASLEQYLTPFKGDYALGVMVNERDGDTAIWHNGGIEGFNSWLGYDPDREIIVAVLANINGPSADKLGISLMRVARGEDVVLPSDREAAVIDTAALAQYEGTYALAPTFKIRVFLEGEQLKAQATGQSAFDLFAQEGEGDFFFLKVVDAQLRFNRGADGEVESLTLFQGGRESVGTKE